MGAPKSLWKRRCGADILERARVPRAISGQLVNKQEFCPIFETLFPHMTKHPPLTLSLLTDYSLLARPLNVDPAKLC